MEIANNDKLLQVLRKWGYGEDVQKKFKDESIRLRHLPHMSEYSLQKFFPAIGERMDFAERVKSLKEIPDEVNKIPLGNHGRNTDDDFLNIMDITEFLMDDNSPSTSVKAGVSGVGTSPVQSVITVPSSTSTPNQTPNTSTAESSDCSLLLPGSLDTSSTSANSSTKEIENTNSRKRVLTEACLNNQTAERSCAQATLQDLLQRTPDGKMIHSNLLKGDDKITDHLRHNLADEIVKYELRDDIDKSMPNTTIEYWTREILGTRPEEAYEVWAGCAEGKMRSSAAGRGMILMRYYNYRRKLIKAGLLKKSVDPKPTKENRGTGSAENVSEEVKIALQVISNISLSLNNIISEWKLTSKSRMQKLKNSNQTLAEYFDLYPVLKLGDSAVLIEIDFEALYPEHTLKLFTEWPVLSAFILSKVNIAEKDSVDDSFTPDGKKLKIIRLLHSLFNVKTIFCKGRKQWRPSRSEARDALIYATKTPAELLPAVNERREKYAKYGLNFSPQAMVVSLDESVVEKSHVVINQVWLTVDNPLKALDVAFKAMHVFDAQYPRECTREMLFLQRAVYGINLPCDAAIRDPKTNALITEYQQFKA